MAILLINVPLRYAEIYDVYVLLECGILLEIANHDVLGLQVAVNVALFVQLFQ